MHVYGSGAEYRSRNNCFAVVEAELNTVAAVAELNTDAVGAELKIDAIESSTDEADRCTARVNSGVVDMVAVVIPSS